MTVTFLVGKREGGREAMQVESGYELTRARFFCGEGEERERGGRGRGGGRGRREGGERGEEGREGREGRGRRGDSHFFWGVRMKNLTQRHEDPRRSRREDEKISHYICVLCVRFF